MIVPHGCHLMPSYRSGDGIRCITRETLFMHMVTCAIFTRWQTTMAYLCVLLVGCRIDFASAQTVAESSRASGPTINPAKGIQAFARIIELPEQAGKDTNVARIMKAYYQGKPTAIGLDGTEIPYAASLGLATCDWTQRPAASEHTETPLRDKEPFITVDRTTRGQVVGSSPIEVADGLWCSISLCVIDQTHKKAHEMDYLVGSVHFCGGKPIANAVDEPAMVGDRTLVDLWSETNSDRITLGDWNRQGNHLSAGVYGPLLYRVLSSSPEYLLIGDQKITLPKKIRNACVAICTKVDSLREANGQVGRPVFRDIVR